MNPMHDEVICIRSSKYSESSQVVTLFGREYGKIRALAKGSRKPKSSFRSAVEVLSHGDIAFHQPKGDANLSILHSYDQKNIFAGLRNNLIALNCATFMVDILSQFTEDYDPHEVLFDQLVLSLSALESTERPEGVLIAFELSLLNEVGLSPVLHHCCHCQQPIEADASTFGKNYFSSQSGGLVCRDCEPGVVEKRFVKPETIQIIQMERSLGEFSRRDLLEAHELLCYHQRELLGRQSKMMVFVNNLLKQQIYSA